MSRVQKLSAAVALLAAACCAAALVASASGRRAAASAPADSEESRALKLFADHRKWTRVNPERARMDGATATLCRAPNVAEPGTVARGPHALKFVSVYVNDAGTAAMTAGKGSEFPRGSVIVKEKFGVHEGGEAELMTAMVKRGPGFNPESGDWEYFVLDGAGAKVQARGRLETCAACHAGRKEWDYTFRTYLQPAERRAGE